jgi:hypothetical protein
MIDSAARLVPVVESDAAAGVEADAAADVEPTAARDLETDADEE